MLTIRGAQMAALQATQELRFVRELLTFFEEFGEENGIGTSHIDLESLQRTIERAGQHGLSTKSELTAFCIVELLICKDFAESQFLRDVMANPGETPGKRLERVLFGLDDEDWEIVATETRAR